MGTREPGQARNGAAFIGIARVPQIAWPPPHSPGTRCASVSVGPLERAVRASEGAPASERPTAACVAAERRRASTVRTVKVHLVDGTYELFRQHFGSANRRNESGREAGEFDATIGVLTSTLQLIEEGATHVGVASDHTIESFRNELYEGYKTSEGMLPELLHQIPIMEDALEAMGVTTWRMVEWEADDALGAAAHVADQDERVEQALIVTADKDLGQCVVGQRIVQYDRRKREIIDEDGVREKFGVSPESIPDYLGLVGDTADGFPGLAGWGAKSTSLVLDRYTHLEQIPPEASLWEVDGLRGAAKLSKTLQDNMELALLFRIIATVDREVPVGTVDDWKWNGPTDQFGAMCQRLGVPGLATRAAALAP